MPHKKNPDIAELTRGRAAIAIGHLTGLMALQKGLPMTYKPRPCRRTRQRCFAIDDYFGRLVGGDDRSAGQCRLPSGAARLVGHRPRPGRGAGGAGCPVPAKPTGRWERCCRPCLLTEGRCRRPAPRTSRRSIPVSNLGTWLSPNRSNRSAGAGRPGAPGSPRCGSNSGFSESGWVSGH